MNVLELRVGGFYKSNGYEKDLFVDPENKTNTGWVNSDEPFVLLSKPIDYDEIVSGKQITQITLMKILTSSGIVGWGIWYTNVEFEELTTGEKT